MIRRRPNPRASQKRGVALLMVVSTIAILALVLVEFSTSARTHLNAGVNTRDDLRATAMAETALVMTRACLDQTAWGPMVAQQRNMDMERICNLMLGVFVRGRVDFPVGGLSLELNGIEGLGLSKGDVEEITLQAEEGFIGLGGLYCPGRGSQAMNCSTRLSTMRRLRSLLCDPRLAESFEKEQADGKRYTREEVLGNLIDWVDADDNRIYIDPQTQALSEGAGEGEDAYLREGDQRYRSKDAPYDSIEELRMVRGIDDTLFDFLKDKLSVHAAGKVNINSANTDVIAALLQAASPAFQQVESGSCGEDASLPGFYREMFLWYASLIVEARTAKQGFFVSKPYKNANTFIKDAKDPVTAYAGYAGRLTGVQISPQELLAQRYGPQFLPVYQAFAGTELVRWDMVKRAVRTDNNLFRLRVRGRVGNMTRKVFAILRVEGKTVRTLYYREE